MGPFKAGCPSKTTGDGTIIILRLLWRQKSASARSFQSRLNLSAKSEAALRYNEEEEGSTTMAKHDNRRAADQWSAIARYGRRVCVNWGSALMARSAAYYAGDLSAEIFNWPVLRLQDERYPWLAVNTAPATAQAAEASDRHWYNNASYIIYLTSPSAVSGRARNVICLWSFIWRREILKQSGTASCSRSVIYAQAQLQKYQKTIEILATEDGTKLVHSVRV